MKDCIYCGGEIWFDGEQWVDEFGDPRCPRRTDGIWHHPRDMTEWFMRPGGAGDPARPAAPKS